MDIWTLWTTDDLVKLLLSMRGMEALQQRGEYGMGMGFISAVKFQ
jgi:hypothetical protein